MLSNIFLIARNEWRSAVRSRTVHLTAVVLGLAVLSALFISWHNTRILNAERERFQELVRSNWLEQPDRHPHRTAHYGYLAFRPKSSLSFFDSGVDSYAGTSVFLEAHRQNTANFSEARNSNGLLRFGEFTVAMILQMIVPLAIFFLGFSAIAGERERGTLSLLVAQGASIRSIVIGKTLGLLGTIAALMAPLLLIAAVLWFILIDFRIDAELLFRICVLFLAYSGFYFVCAVLSVGVSAFAGSSGKALTALVIIWIVFWVAVPRTVQHIGSVTNPAPTKAEFDRVLAEDLSKEGDSHNPNDPKFADLKREVLNKYGVTDVKDLPFNYNGYLMAKSEEISSGIFRKRYSELLATFKRQNRAVEIAGLVNPFLALKTVSMSASSTDFSAFEHFGLQTEEYRYSMIQRLNDLHANEIKHANDRAQKVGSETWREFPEFKFAEPSLSETLGAQSVAIISLHLWTAFAFAGIWLIGKRARI